MSKTPTLIADFDTGEGTIGLPPEWHEWSAITRADILMDWIYELSLEYNFALENLRLAHFQKQEASE